MKNKKTVAELCTCGKCGVTEINVKGLCSAKLKPWNTLKYWVWDKVTWIQLKSLNLPVKEFTFSKTASNLPLF